MMKKNTWATRKGIPDVVTEYFTQLVIRDHFGQSQGVATEKKAAKLIKANLKAFLLLPENEQQELIQEAHDFFAEEKQFALANLIRTEKGNDWEDAFKKLHTSQELVEFSDQNQQALIKEHNQRAVAHYILAILDENNAKNPRPFSEEKLFHTAESLAKDIVNQEESTISLTRRIVLKGLNLDDTFNAKMFENNKPGIILEGARDYALRAFDTLLPFVHHQILESRVEIIKQQQLAKMGAISANAMKETIERELPDMDTAAAKLCQHILGLSPPYFTPNEISRYIEPIGLSGDTEWELSEVVTILENAQHFSELDMDFWTKANEVVVEVLGDGTNEEIDQKAETLESFERLLPFVHHQILESRMLDQGRLAEIEALSDLGAIKEALEQEISDINAAAAKLCQQIQGMPYEAFTSEELELIAPMGLSNDSQWTPEEFAVILQNAQYFSEIDMDFWAKANKVVCKVLSGDEIKVLDPETECPFLAGATPETTPDF